MSSNGARSEEDDDSCPGMVDLPRPRHRHAGGGEEEDEEGDEEEHWSDWESQDGGEEQPTKCLFAEQVVASPQAALDQDKAATGFDLGQVVQQHRLDFYGAIKVVNFIRTRIRAGATPMEVTSLFLHGLPFARDDESLLIPVLENDPLLFSLENLLAAEGVELELPEKSEVQAGTGEEEEKGSSAVSRLKEENEALKLQVQELQARLSRLSEITADMDADVQVPAPRLDKEDNDLYYFESYAHFSIHETMLRDEVRTGGYAQAIKQNADILIKGKVVLDIGCGTGVLSMFCAKAGAARVVGVDCSDIIDQAKDIVVTNKLDQQVSLVKGKMEEVSLPVGVERVDVIVSEWMGYCLLYESMLPSVLWARDRYLAPGGAIMPNRCTMLLQAMEDLDGRLGWWEDVHGLDMRRLVDLVVAEPSVEVVNPKALISSRCLIRDIDIMTVRDQDLDFEVVVERASTPCALVVYFDTEFGYPPSINSSCSEGGAGKVVTFSTGPEAPPTHWKQTVFWLKGAPRGSQAQAPMSPSDTIQGTFQLGRNRKNPRELDVRISWQTVRSGGGGASGVSQRLTQLYHLGTG